MQSSISGSTFELQVIVNDAPAPVYNVGGQFFVKSVVGAAYELLVTNQSSGRIEVIAAVDGRHLGNDEEANLSTCRGLVVPGHGSYRFKGWRVDDTHSRQLVFTEPAQSVAAQAGKPSRIGTIGVAAFTELYSWSQKPATPWWPKNPVQYDVGDYGLESLRQPSGGHSYKGGTKSASVQTLGADHGTGIGASQRDEVGRTSFTRSSGTPAQLTELYYRSRQWLQAHGVILGDELPSAFVTSMPTTGYEQYRTVS